MGFKLSIPTLPHLASTIKPSLVLIATSNKLPMVARALSMVTPVDAAVAVGTVAFQHKNAIASILGSVGSGTLSIAKKVEAPVASVAKQQRAL